MSAASFRVALIPDLPDTSNAPRTASTTSDQTERHPNELLSATARFVIPNYDPGPTFHPLPPIPGTISTSSAPVGSFEHDSQHKYTLRWPSMAAMHAWMKAECRDKSIEFVKKHHRRHPPGITTWEETDIYVCARQGSGGNSKYCPTKGWKRKISSKRTGCPCRITVKTYPNTPEILGYYKADHAHAIGDDNLKYLRLDLETRQEIERMLRLGVEPKKILENITQNMYHERNLDQTRANKAQRHHFVTRTDIRRIQKMIEEESIRLAAQDGPSVLAWVAKLREEGHFVALKRSNEPPPAGTHLERDSFVLIIQTKYQGKCWQEYGNKFAGIDGTHNTTHYLNMTLFTLLVRDNWGHGMPAAFMVSSNGKEVTIDHFLATILRLYPDICPHIFMSDFDWAQLNSITRRYPKSRLLLCWWHVLHAWQAHFVIQHFPELWERLKHWIRITDQAEFNACWEAIQTLAPASVIQYLNTYWMRTDVVKMWSAVYRLDRSIFEICDTNMLVEAWHHLLKGDFLEGKRNRRLDHLIHVFYDIAIPYFIARHRRQELGFEGPDLAFKRRVQVIERAASIKKDDIQYDPEDGKYIMRSQSDPEVFYHIDLDVYDCTCLSFPLIRFCKHICAIQNHFPEAKMTVPVSCLDTGNESDSDSESDESSASESDADGPSKQPSLIPAATAGHDALAQLTERLNSISLLLRTSTPAELNEVQQASIHHATHILDTLSADLTPAFALLPAKTKIPSNKKF